jgi:hypothetical protein
MFSNSNYNSAKYLISRNYYIQVNKTWYYINVYSGHEIQYKETQK